MKTKDSKIKNRIGDKYASYRNKAKDSKDKPENLTSTAKKLFSLLKGKEAAVIFTVVCACLSSLLTILGPQYLGDIIDVLDVQVKNKLATGKMVPLHLQMVGWVILEQSA